LKLDKRTRANFRAKHCVNGRLAEGVRGEIAIRTMASARSYPKLPAIRGPAPGFANSPDAGLAEAAALLLATPFATHH